MLLDSDKLISEVKLEFSSSLQQNFPHIYGKINKEAVMEVKSLKEYIL